MKKLQIILCFLLLFLSCSKSDQKKQSDVKQIEKKGVITARWFKPEDDKEVMIPIYNGGTTLFINSKVHNDEKWCVKVKEVGSNNVQEYQVTQVAYDTLKIGKEVIIKGVSIK
jgi:hypothetical protein